MRILVICVAVLAALPSSLSAQARSPSGVSSNAPLWRCDDPTDPFRFEEDSSKRANPPVCRKWVQIRAPKLLAILTAVSETKFDAANAFLAEAAAASDMSYPVTAAGHPVSTSAFYSSPERFGFVERQVFNARPGSLVLYDGLGGILIEVRDTPESPWRKELLYPSARHDFGLTIRSLSIAGRSEPKIVESQARAVVPP